VIGFYCPEKWENTEGKENSYGDSNSQDIVSGKPFLFYFLDNHIEIINHKDDKKPSMRSNELWLMQIV